jgi:hypothetical protein
MMLRTPRYTPQLVALARASTDFGLRAALLVAFMHVFGCAAIAESCATLKSDTVMLADSIALRVASDLPPEVVSAAIEYWRRCANYEEGFPELIVAGVGTQILDIRYAGSRGDSRCGDFRGRTITLYRWALLADGTRVRCGSLPQNLAHELGHALGLRDAREGAECRRRIMSQINSSNRASRRVESSDCQVVGQRWLTFSESRRRQEIQRRLLGGSP